MRLICDTESNGFVEEATRLWCIAAIDIDTLEEYYYDPTTIEEGLLLLTNAELVVGHNFVGHDVPLITKLYPDWVSPDVLDTFIMSSLFNPDRTGGHSIEAWGKRIGRYKPEHEDWTQYSEEMLHRCREDTAINLEVYHLLNQESSGWDWSQALELEHTQARLQAEQEKNGVLFDIKKARQTYKKLDDEITIIEAEAMEELPLRPKQYGAEVKKPFLKSGSYSKMVTDWEIGDVSGPFSRIIWEEFNLNSHDQIKQYFLNHGWIPDEWNYKKKPNSKQKEYDEYGEPIRTSPKLTESSYDSIQSSLPKRIARRNVLTHRRSLIYNVKKDGTISGWTQSIRADGRIPARAVCQATNTGRYRHSVVVNVPKAEEDVIYGKEMRELFTVPDDKVMVGTDADALENRMECHYVYPYEGGPEYAELILSGDPHTVNATAFSEALGIEITRSIAKNIKYALTYGARAAKLAETASCSKAGGQVLYDTYWEVNHALARLRDDTILSVKKKGYVVGLDGRKVFIRSPHSALNALFQSAGSITVKTATNLVWTDERILETTAKRVIHMHDEWQAELSPEDTEIYSLVCKESWLKAGETYQLNVPTTGDIQVGRNWAETH